MGLEQAALIRLLMRDRAKLFAYIWSIVRDEHVAEDILQDVSALVVEKSAEIESESHLLGWARAAARNKCLMALRRRRTGPALLDATVIDQLEAQWSEYDAVDSSEVVDALRGCIEQLTPRSREIIRMRYASGLSGQQLAEFFQQQAKSLYVTISRIHRTLGECVRRRIGGVSG